MCMDFFLKWRTHICRFTQQHMWEDMKFTVSKQNIVLNLIEQKQDKNKKGQFKDSRAKKSMMTCSQF